MGGKKANFRGSENKGGEARQQDREGVELFYTEACSWVGIVMKS